MFLGFDDFGEYIPLFGEELLHVDPLQEFVCPEAVDAKIGTHHQQTSFASGLIGLGLDFFLFMLLGGHGISRIRWRCLLFRRFRGNFVSFEIALEGARYHNAHGVGPRGFDVVDLFVELLGNQLEITIEDETIAG